MIRYVVLIVTLSAPPGLSNDENPPQQSNRNLSPQYVKAQKRFEKVCSDLDQEIVSELQRRTEQQHKDGWTKGAMVRHAREWCRELGILHVYQGCIGALVTLETKPDAPMPTYDVVDRDTYDASVKTQIELHAVVSGTLTELGLKQLLQKLYDEANATRAFKYHGGKPTHVFIYLYTSRDHFKSGMGQWIAMLSKIGDNSRVDTQIKTELISQLAAKPEVKYGLPESKRKEIFRAIVTAEDRAVADAQRMYPLPDPLKPGYSQAKAGAQVMKQLEAENTLMKKYKTEVAKRYGITKKQLRDISVEAIKKNWPMP